MSPGDARNRTENWWRDDNECRLSALSNLIPRAFKE